MRGPRPVRFPRHPLTQCEGLINGGRWWKPSGRRGPIARPRLILVCDRTLVGIDSILSLAPRTQYSWAAPLIFHYCQRLLRKTTLFSGAALPRETIEIDLIIAGLAGLLILIAPNRPEAERTVDGRRFPVKPTCPLLYYLVLGGGMGAVAFSAVQLLASGTSNWAAGAGFGFGLHPGSARYWATGRPPILDGQGLLEGRCASSRIRWQRLKHVRAYRIRCDRGVVIHGDGGKQLVVADIAHDSEAWSTA